jgi:HK97 family phage major capsid protein
MTQTLAPETKSGDVAAAFDDFARSFEAFKQVNDDRLAEIETRLSADVITEEKLARIDAALDESKRRLDRVQIERGRPALAGLAERADPMLAEHKAAFDLYVRAGEASGLKGLEAKALQAGSGPDGGYLVPDNIEKEVLRRLPALSPIRAIASVRLIAGGNYKRAFSIAGPASGWVGETAPRPQTAAPALAEMAFPAMELYAMPAATQTLLDDAILNVEQWLADEVQTAFAEQEGVAFVKGDGINKPEGFLAEPTVADDAWSWGALGYLATGAAGASEGRLSAERQLRDEPAHAERYPQVQGFLRRLSLAAAGFGGRGRDPDVLPGRGGRGHARHRGEFARARLRRFPPRLPRRRPHRHPRPARSVFGQALRAVLHDQARGRRRPGLRRDQAPALRGVGLFREGQAGAGRPAR